MPQAHRIQALLPLETSSISSSTPGNRSCSRRIISGNTTRTTLGNDATRTVPSVRSKRLQSRLRLIQRLEHPLAALNQDATGGRQPHAPAGRSTRATRVSRSNADNCWDTAEGVNHSASATAAIVPRCASSRSTRNRETSEHDVLIGHPAIIRPPSAGLPPSRRRQETCGVSVTASARPYMQHRVWPHGDGGSAEVVQDREGVLAAGGHLVELLHHRPQLSVDVDRSSIDE